MILDQSANDLATLIHKIKTKEVDLQPDFQRGQVWSDSKKKRLIDTILRQWYVPAIHLVVNEELDIDEVLDGQQRLQAIMEFYRGKYTVDGSIEPADEKIKALGGLRYKDLPAKTKSKFRRFSINTVRLREFNPNEPGELFFRLNQIAALTAAEQRNALIGEPRNQIKKLSGVLERRVGWSIGFSNARMNYDDVLVRLACCIEANSLSLKMTATSLERRYRSDIPFAVDVIKKITRSVRMLQYTVDHGLVFRHNKATLFSWLYFFNEQSWLWFGENKTALKGYYAAFETMRSSETSPFRQDVAAEISPSDRSIIAEAVGIFNDRSTSRVNDVSSILLRDLMLNTVLMLYLGSDGKKRIGKDRQAAVEHAYEQLKVMPEDVAEAALVEADLARAWGTYRA